MTNDRQVLTASERWPENGLRSLKRSVFNCGNVSSQSGSTGQRWGLYLKYVFFSLKDTLSVVFHDHILRSWQYKPHIHLHCIQAWFLSSPLRTSQLRFNQIISRLSFVHKEMKIQNPPGPVSQRRHSKQRKGVVLIGLLKNASSKQAVSYDERWPSHVGQLINSIPWIKSLQVSRSVRGFKQTLYRTGGTGGP